MRLRWQTPGSEAASRQQQREVQAMLPCCCRCAEARTAEGTCHVSAESMESMPECSLVVHVAAASLRRAAPARWARARRLRSAVRAGAARRGRGRGRRARTAAQAGPACVSRRAPVVTRPKQAVRAAAARHGAGGGGQQRQGRGGAGTYRRRAACRLPGRQCARCAAVGIASGHTQHAQGRTAHGAQRVAKGVMSYKQKMRHAALRRQPARGSARDARRERRTKRGKHRYQKAGRP
jgi:hypothetical protein